MLPAVYRLKTADEAADASQIGRKGRTRMKIRRPGNRLTRPKEWRTRTYCSGKEKSLRCYSLSSGGAYFVTPRPWVVGSDITLELPVGRERLLVAAHILYTNMGNASNRRSLPRGMAVAFRPLSEHIQQVIRRDVTATHQTLEVRTLLSLPNDGHSALFSDCCAPANEEPAPWIRLDLTRPSAKLI